MKALILVLTVISVSAISAEWNGTSIVLTPQEAQACARQGGCTVVTRAWMEQTQNTMLDLMLELSSRPAEPQTCRRNST